MRSAWRVKAKSGAVCAVLAAALALAACHRHDPQKTPSLGAAMAAGRKGQIILLPDSAIVVQPGSLEERLAHFLASDQPAPRAFRFTDPAFAPWADKPNPQSLRAMYALAQILRAYPNASVELDGYTDNVGSEEQNLALSRQRVDRLKTLLADAGVREGRITTEGKGATGFIADNATEEGRAKNRRIELIVTGK